MPVAGIDVGAVATKVAVFEEKEVLTYALTSSRPDAGEVASHCLNLALVKIGLHRSDIDYVVSTGYGRRNVDFADKTVTEITAQASGVKYHFPATRTIIDIGGQDSKAISLDEHGAVVNFLMNDRCAAGTGRFLEVMSITLGVNLEDLGRISVKSKTQAEISSMCTVFAESEVISLMAQGRCKDEIIAGLHTSIAKRVAVMAKQLGIMKDVIFTGGVAKNIGVKVALEKVLSIDVKTPPEPQLTGALGAALIACKYVNPHNEDTIY